MHITAEIRWFWEGQEPEGVEAWLQRAGYPYPPPETRTDYYLVTGSGHGSVKLRECNIESKLLVKTITLPGRLHELGHAGTWTKWSGPEIAEDSPGLWQPVTKQRRVATYLPGRQIWAEPEKGESVCEVETGTITLEGREFKSLCLECHTSGGDEEKVLIRSLNELIDNAVFSILDKNHSFSYPIWLVTIL